MRQTTSRMKILPVLSFSLFLLTNTENLQAQGVTDPTDPQIPPVLKAGICKKAPVHPLCNQKINMTIVEQGKEQHINETRFAIFQRLRKPINQSGMSKENKDIAEQQIIDILSLVEPQDGGTAGAKKPEHTIKTSCTGGSSGGQESISCTLGYEIKF